MGRYLELLKKATAERAQIAATKVATKGATKGDKEYSDTPLVASVASVAGPVAQKEEKEPGDRSPSVLSNKIKLSNDINDIPLNPSCTQRDQGDGDTLSPDPTCDKSDKSDQSPFSTAFITFRESLKSRTLNQRYVMAVADASIFLRDWGAQAEALGWSADDLFDINPGAPLARYDAMGLVWMLQGQRVVALTADAATIKTESGSFLKFYRRGVSHVWAKCI